MGNSTRFPFKQKEEICLECKVKCDYFNYPKKYPFILANPHKVLNDYKIHLDLSLFYQYCKNYKPPEMLIEE